MKESLLIAGFGGQGIMLLGKLIAYTAMKEGYQVTMIPSYGPEMRGGTANCTVTLSDEKIGSPLTAHPDTVIIMNQPSLEKFAPAVKKDGKILVNSCLVKKGLDKMVKQELIPVPANRLAREIGEERVANMVLLGAYLVRNRFLTMENIKDSLRELIGEKGEKLLALNYRALELGARI
jgi:2-oxoglutarate ferredoxin oxidoreductase subunit gamma